MLLQEHQDTGNPLVLPQDIRLLQDHNGQKPHDVAAAFYEEVPEVWDHLKLVRLLRHCLVSLLLDRQAQ